MAQDDPTTETESTWQPAPPPVPPAPAPAGELTADGMMFGKPLATPWHRLGAFLLDAVLMIVTLGIGWLIWAAMTAQKGQTPGKKLAGIRVHDANTGEPLGLGRMLLLRGIVGGIIMNIATSLVIGIVLWFMPFWDKRNQTFYDKISSSVGLVDQG